MKLAKCHPSVSHSEGTNVLVHAVSNKGGAGWQMGCLIANILTIGRLVELSSENRAGVP